MPKSTPLADEVAKVAARVRKATKGKINDQNTKAQMIVLAIAATAPVQRPSLATAHAAQGQDLKTAICGVTSKGEMVSANGEERWRVERQAMTCGTPVEN